MKTMAIKKTEGGEARRAELEKRLEDHIFEPRFGQVFGGLASLVHHLWYVQPNIAVDVPRRVACPACGMNGARFIRCGVCGGPMCDNCKHMAHGLEVCLVCRNDGGKL